MSQADLDKWESRYGALDPQREGPEPEPFITDAVRDLVPGAAVDVAGGAGRHALWLAARGWTTTVVDISPTGLALAQRAARRLGCTIHTVTADFDDRDDIARALPAEAFDLVVCAWFLPSPELWRRMVAALRHGGHLLYVMPTQTNHARNPHPSPRFLVPDGWVPDHLRQLGLTLVTHEEGWDARGNHTARALAARPT